MGEVIRLSTENWLTLKFLKESTDFLAKRNNDLDRKIIKQQKALFKHFLTNPT